MDALITPRATPPALPPVVQRGLRVALAAIVIGLGAYTLWNFLPALVWAAIFAIALWPWYRRMQAKCSYRAHSFLLPAGFTLVVALVFIIPIVLVGVQLARETSQAVEWARNVHEHGIPVPEALHHLPFGADAAAGWWQDNLADPGAADDLLGRLRQGNAMGYSRHLGAEVLHRLVLFGFTVVTLFFLFKDGPSLAEQTQCAVARAFGPGGERISRQIIASIHGTVDGLVLVGLGEGVLLGVVYAVAGVPHPTVFGALTAVAAMIPFAAPVVFGAAALLLAAQGGMVAGIVVFLLGMLVTFTADHFVRPVLIGGATKLPFLWVLLGILGGVEAWGLLGLFLGPAIMAVLMLLWREWVDEGARVSSVSVRS